VVVVGIGASLAFDICGKPTPPSPPAPVVPEPAPQLTPMSKNQIHTELNDNRGGIEPPLSYISTI
jgi:hypothetical protein